MSTSISGYLTPEEKQDLRQAIETIKTINFNMPESRFHFLANFDGTNNNKDNLPLSDNPYQTNVANIYDQAKGRQNDYFQTGYYPGVGTGGSSSAGLFH